MLSLRFDHSGAMNPDDGLTPEQLASIAATLESLRDEMLRNDSSSTPPFMRLPEQQLTAYETVREDSELGRVFKVANGLHDRVDAVVVLGVGSVSLGPEAMFRACCDPYHNELTRAARGSKPRMYFAGNNFDNDDSAALLSRLSAGGYGDSPVEQRWAIIAIDPSVNAAETTIAFRHFLKALERQLGDRAPRILRDLVIPIAGPSSELLEVAGRIGCAETFHVSSESDNWFNVLSPIGLLPAAMLGLDCMKLLAGAVAMTEHFKSAAFAENLVLRYVAVNHLLAKHHGKHIRVLNVWNEALESVGCWYDQLLTSTLPDGEVTPMAIVNTRDTAGRKLHHGRGANNRVFNNLIVTSCRQDPLGTDSVAAPEGNDRKRKKPADPSFLDIMSAAVQRTNDELRANRRPTTDITLPRIDTHELGQLFQMLMLATHVESNLP